MASAKCLAFAVIFFVNFHQCYAGNYSDYLIYNVRPSHEDHLHFLEGLLKNQYIDVIFINYPVMSEITQILVNRAQEHLFAEKVAFFKMSSEVLFHDAQQAFDLQLSETRRADEITVFNHYNTLEQVYQWLNETAKKHPIFCSLEVIGQSGEGRDIFALAVKQPSNTRYQSYKVIMESNSHGNEWLATSFTMFFIENLLTDDDPFTQLKKRFFWYFIPVLNPDGYEYSQKTDRLWVKNRRKLEHSVGVNLNRNFDYNFGQFDATDDPLSQLYPGPSAFSEPETQVLKKFIERKQEDLMFYFSVHGHGQKFILPFSDTHKHLVNFHEVQAYAKKAIDSIQTKFDKIYKVGTAEELLGKKYSGDSASWVKKTYNIPYVMTIQLRDDGEYGPVLPSNQIEPACQEMMEGLIQVMTYTGKLAGTAAVISFSNVIRPQDLLLIIVVFFVMLC